MKKIKWFAICLIAALTMMSCGNQDEKEPENKVKTLEAELTLDGYGADTIITVKEFEAEISEVKNDTDWLAAELLDVTTDGYQIKLICRKNTTANARKAEIVITCKNQDSLTLKITQGVCNGFDDVHDNVSDQPPLAPMR